MIHFLLCNYKQQAFQRADPLPMAQIIEKYGERASHCQLIAEISLYLQNQVTTKTSC